MLRRHAKSFVKGATGSTSGTVAGAIAQPVGTPSEVLAKATRMLRRAMALQLAWFVLFIAGGVMTLWSAWESHSLLVPLLLLAIGTTGTIVTAYVTTRVAAKYLGAGANAVVRHAGLRTTWSRTGAVYTTTATEQAPSDGTADGSAEGSAAEPPSLGHGPTSSPPPGAGAGSGA